MDKSARQKTLLTIGKYGCYLLCLIYIAEKRTGRHYDVEQVYNLAKAAGLIQEDCFIGRRDGTVSAHLILRQLTEREYRYEKSEEWNHIGRPKSAGIARFERITSETGKTVADGHFVVMETPFKVEYDPMGDSETVKKGRIVSYRIFEEV